MKTSSLTFERLKSLVMLNLLGERRRVVECLEQGMAPGEVLERMSGSNRSEGRGDPAGRPYIMEFNPEKEIEACERLGVRLVTWFDADDPQ